MWLCTKNLLWYKNTDADSCNLQDSRWWTKKPILQILIKRNEFGDFRSIKAAGIQRPRPNRCTCCCFFFLLEHDQCLPENRWRQVADSCNFLFHKVSVSKKILCARWIPTTLVSVLLHRRPPPHTALLTRPPPPAAGWHTHPHTHTDYQLNTRQEKTCSCTSSVCWCLTSH